METIEGGSLQTWEEQGEELHGKKQFTAAVRHNGAWREAEILETGEDELTLKIWHSDCVSGNLVDCFAEDLKLRHDSDDLWMQELEDGEVEWIEECPEGHVSNLSDRVLEYIQGFSPLDSLHLYNAAFFGGEGIVRVGDIVTFAVGEGSRPFVGLVEALFEAQGWPAGPKGDWKVGTRVQALWREQVSRQDGESEDVERWYTGKIIKKNSNHPKGTYFVEFDDGNSGDIHERDIRQIQGHHCVARWFWRHEETALSERQKEKLLNCRGEVLLSDEYDVQELKAVDCSRVLMTYVPEGESRDKWYVDDFDSEVHMHPSFDAEERPDEDSALRLCCGFTYDHQRKKANPLSYEKGAARRMLMEMESGKMLPVDIPGEGEAKAGGKRRGGAFDDTCVKRERAEEGAFFEDTVNIGAPEEDLELDVPLREVLRKVSKGLGAHSKKRRQAVAARAAAATVLKPRHDQQQHKGATSAAGGKEKVSQQSISRAAEERDWSEPPAAVLSAKATKDRKEYMKKLDFLRHLEEKDRPRVPLQQGAAAGRGIKNLTRDMRQQRLDYLVNEYVRIYLNAPGGLPCALKKAIDREKSTFETVYRTPGEGVDSYIAKLRTQIFRLKDTGKRMIAADWSEDEEELEVVDSVPMETQRQSMVSAMIKRKQSREGSRGVGGGSTGLGKSLPKPLCTDVVQGFVREERRAAGGRKDRGDGEKRKAVSAEEEFLRELGVSPFKFSLSDMRPRCAISNLGDGLEREIAAAFELALGRCEEECKKPQLHMEQFSSILNVKAARKKDLSLMKGRGGTAIEEDLD